MGKTAFSINIAEYVAVESNCPLPYSQWRWAAHSWSCVVLGSVGRLDQHVLKTGRLQDEHWGRLNEAVVVVRRPMFIDETSRTDRARNFGRGARRLARQFEANRTDCHRLPATDGGFRPPGQPRLRVRRNLLARSKPWPKSYKFPSSPCRNGAARWNSVPTNAR